MGAAVTKPRDASAIVAMIATVLMIALSFCAKPGSTYRFSFAFLAPLIWLVYAIRHRLYLRPIHIALIGSALLLHNLGVFGFYRREFWSLQFDTYVHFYFGFVGGLLMRAGLEGAYSVRGWRVWVAVILGILGLGAIHELIEWGSTMLLGPERGMLKALADDPYDTQKDLLNNFLGSVLGLMCSSLAAAYRKRRTQISAPANACPRNP
jgi:uncharacterized membrane protein YjdF